MTENSADSEAIETRLRVLTWNLWWRFGDWQSRRAAIEATIGSIDADVIALQEVWSDDSTNFASELAEVFGYNHVYARSMDIKGYGFGNALLSRWPILRHDSTLLSGLEETGEGRVALHADIDGPRGVIPAFSTHLNWKFPQSHIRQQQVTDLARFVDSKRPWTFPPVVCGDFNAEPCSEEMRMLTGLTTCPVVDLSFHDAWLCAGDGSHGFTWDNLNPYAVKMFEPNRRIDYILAGWPEERGAGHVVSCRLAGNEAVDGIWPSDHHAVCAELRY